MSERNRSQSRGSQSQKRLQKQNFQPPRELTVREREVLEFLLSQPFQGHELLHKQLGATRVDHGYINDASISLVVDRSAAQPATVYERVPVIATGMESEGVPFSVFIFVDNGYLSYLEIAPFKEEATITILPPKNSLTLQYISV